MKTPKPIVVVLGLAGVATLAWWRLSLPDDVARLPEGPTRQAHPQQTAPAEHTSAPTGPEPVNLNPAQSSQGDGLAAPPPESKPVQLTRQLAAITEVYAAEVQYPPYSKPITAHNVSYLDPNRFTAVEMPVLGGSAMASLSLPKYRFFDPEAVTLSLNTELSVSAIRFDFYDLARQQRFLTKYTDHNTLTVAGHVSWPKEIRVKATVDFDRGTDVLTADFRYEVPVAYVNSADAPTAQGADMLIPLNLEVTQAGIYRIRANLYRHDGEVIAALSSKSRLGEGRQSLSLKVHHSVLGNTEGRYQLKNWVVERMSGRPGEKASFGISREPVMTLEPFQVSTLSQEAYTPSLQEQQRLDFLRRASAS